MSEFQSLLSRNYISKNLSVIIEQANDDVSILIITELHLEAELQATQLFVTKGFQSLLSRNYISKFFQKK